MPESSVHPNGLHSSSATLLTTIGIALAGCATGSAPMPGAPAAEAEAPVSQTVPLETAAEAAPATAVDRSAADATSPVAAYLDDPAAVTAGRRLFRAVCTGYCHSTTPGVTKDAPNLFDCEQTHGNEDDDLFNVITQGVPDTEMLPFDGKITEEQIWQVIAYIRTNSMDCG